MFVGESTVDPWIAKVRWGIWRNAELSVRRMMLIIVIILKETYSTAGFCPYDF